MNPDVLLLDARRNGERNTSYIEGTIHIPFSEIASRIIE